MEDYNVDFYLEQEDIARKKLVRKVFTIVFSMIFILVGIIIVEFKEYSNNYNEYKIGKADLGPKDLVWAGIMGTPPRYYESDTKYGLGYREFATREIRKALESAGLHLIYRYMSPNRLEFEFERKHAICFYDRKWSNPNKYFKTPKYPVLSIPLYYSGNERKKIFFRKGERARFEKHLDSKGNIVLESLIKDKSLKTELIRKVEYDGPYANVTYGKRQLDGTYYDYVKPKYQKNIDLVILHTNDQIIQMLDKKRFDYQFYNILEYDDFFWAKGREKGTETLTYAEPYVKNIDDPNLVFHSVACGNHTLSKYAMPIINEVIKKIRDDVNNYTRNDAYEAKINPISSRINYIMAFNSSVYFGKTIAKADDWYFEQFSKFKKDPWPMFNIISPINPKEIEENEKIIKLAREKSIPPHWFLLERLNKNGEKTLFVLNETEINAKSDQLILKESFLDDDFDNLKDYNENYVEKKLNFKDLDFSKAKLIKKIVIFANGINDHDFKLFSELFQREEIQSATFIELSNNQSKSMLELLQLKTEVIRELRLNDAQLFGIDFGGTIKKLKKLTSLSIHASSKTNDSVWIENKDLLSIVLNISDQLEIFSLIGKEEIWNDGFKTEVAEVFAKRNFKSLKQFRLVNFYLNDKSVKLFFDSFPLNLESLIIGGSSQNSGVSSLLLEEFLEKRENINRLKRLELKKLLFSFRNNNLIKLPKSLEDFSLIGSVGLNDGNFHRIIIHPEIKIKNLNISNNELNDYSIIKLLSKLNSSVDNLNLNSNKITGKVFFSLFANPKDTKINNLILKGNPIDDRGIWALTQLPWEIQNLDISNIKITDNSSGFFTSKNILWNLKNLKSLNLSDNYLSKDSINKILEKYSHTLNSLYLNNVLSLNINALTKHLSKKLEALSISGNILNDDNISLIAKKLHKNLNYLDISGSDMSVKGSIALAKIMPNLTNFYFDFKFGDEQLGLNFLFKNISPFLKDISELPNDLTYENCMLLSKQMPPYLYSLSLYNFKDENCKVLLESLPDSLKDLNIKGNLKSNGSTLKLLANKYPSHLRRITIGDYFQKSEIDEFLKYPNLKYTKISQSGRFSSFTKQFIKNQSYHHIVFNGAIRPEYFEGITFPASTCFIGKDYNDTPKGFLYSLNKFQLQNFQYICVQNGDMVERNELLDFLKKLPTDLQGLFLRNMNIKLEDLDEIINTLPRNLRFLKVIDSFGEKGIKKLKDFKSYMEEKTGLPFILHLQ